MRLVRKTMRPKTMAKKLRYDRIGSDFIARKPRDCRHISARAAKKKPQPPLPILPPFPPVQPKPRGSAGDDNHPIQRERQGEEAYGEQGHRKNQIRFFDFRDSVRSAKPRKTAS